MKCTSAIGVIVLAAAMAGTLRAENLPPGQIEFGAFSPPSSGGEFVEVNLTSSLIALAARFVEKQEPDVAELLNGLQLVRVHVIGLDEGNREELATRAQKIRKELDTKGWERIVTARKTDQDVS